MLIFLAFCLFVCLFGWFVVVFCGGFLGGGLFRAQNNNAGVSEADRRHPGFLAGLG